VQNENEGVPPAVDAGDTRATAGASDATAASQDGTGALREVLEAHRERLAQRWAEATLFRTVYTAGRESAVDAARRLAGALALVAESGRCFDPDAAGFDRARPQLGEMAEARAAAGTTTAQVSMEVSELRGMLVALVRERLAAVGERADGDRAAAAIGAATELMGTMRLVMMETVLDENAGIIARQRQEISEIATPVLTLWRGVLAVPVIGTLDSARSQVLTESLLEGIVERQATVAILDITGVPMVDTVVAQHLMKTAAAVRLMGAECVISGIRPQIAQTIASLGIDLGEIRTRSSLADALAWALRRIDVPAGA
jgi:rsbT co-antagonist protein RsbR